MFLENKNAYINKLFDILNPLLPHYSEGGARLKLGYTGAVYSETVAEAEAFLRVLWGFAPFLAGGGQNATFEEIYLKGLTNGTDPQSSEYWGVPAVNYDQRLCEMASIASAFLLAPEKLWDPLSETAKDNVAQWLNYINQFEITPSNWLFFAVLVNVALKKLGRSESNQAVLTRCLDEINKLYQGDGWYKDGSREIFDYYNAFAFHYYGLIYYAVMKDEDPENAETFKQRALTFGQQFVYWISSTGAAVPYGRSMTYRFAQVAFFSACVFTKVEPLPISTMKGIIDRHLQYWWGTNMKDMASLLSIGYAYPNLIMAESYNAPGSPLWALKSFVLLALADDDPYWSMDAGAFPTLDEQKYLPVPRMIITQRPGNVILYPCGIRPATLESGHFEEKYCKFAYSSKYSFNVRKATDCLFNMAPDSDLVFSFDGLFFGRDSVNSFEVSESSLVSQWSPFPGINVTTTITPSPYGHTRQHVIESTRECVVYDCGFAMPTDAPGYGQETANNEARVHSELGAIYLHMQSSGSGETNGIIITDSPNTNIQAPLSAIPAVSCRIGVGTTTILTTVIVE